MRSQARYTVIERNTASKAVSDVYAELEVITRVSAKDTTKTFDFSNKDNIAKTQEWREGFGNESRECQTVFVWHTLIYYIHKSDKPKTLQEWELVLSKGCVICFEHITKKSIDARPCLTCHAMCCADCNWKQSLPESPVCKAFDMKSYVRYRGVYAAQVLPQLGISMSDMKMSKDMCANQIKELTGFNHLEDLIDSAMVAAGGEVYDMRDQSVALRS